MDEELKKLRKLYKLKEVYRKNTVGTRNESSAEHTWSCLMLADYFLNVIDKKLDRLKVYELLLYHDVVEIEAGDIPIHYIKKRRNKEQEERNAVIKLKENIPKKLGNKLVELFTEFEERKTQEARFAKLIDRMDALIHELDYKDDWKGWTEETVRSFYDHDFEEFPEMEEAFEQILTYVRKNNYYY